MDVREKLVEQAISHFGFGVSHDIFSEPVTTYAKLAIEALKKENSVTVQEWISVEDRLPERGQEVIVYRNDCVYSMRFWDKKHPLWQSTSHWMPLPEPPAED